MTRSTGLPKVWSDPAIAKICVEGERDWQADYDMCILYLSVPKRRVPLPISRLLLYLYLSKSLSFIMGHNDMTEAVGGLHGMLHLERSDLDGGTTYGGEVLENFEDVPTWHIERKRRRR